MNNDILENLNLRIDHACLHSEADEKAIIQACNEAIEYKFFSVATNPVWIKLVSEQLNGTDIKILSVSGFPLGASRTDVKVIEAVKGVDDGAHEIDMVANIGWLASDRFTLAENEISEIRQALPFNVLLKVIIEAGKLTRQQQIDATKAVIKGGAQFVKTSTGFFGGAEVEMVKTLHEATDGQIEVKASGGIKTFEQCRELLRAGATRLGSSSSVAIMQQLQSRTTI